MLAIQTKAYETIMYITHYVHTNDRITARNFRCFNYLQLFDWRSGGLQIEP